MVKTATNSSRELQGRNLAELIKETHPDARAGAATSGLPRTIRNYGFLPYFGDRHTCEFCNCYMTSKDPRGRFKLRRTSIEERQEGYAHAEMMIKLWTEEEGPVSRRFHQKAFERPPRNTEATLQWHFDRHREYGKCR